MDNHDSFTYNVFQLVAGITKSPPVVVVNDDPSWSDDDLCWFDNVIVSAGPGRPDRASDLGISAMVVARAKIPLLGVCLGYQAFCASSPVRLSGWRRSRGTDGCRRSRTTRARFSPEFRRLFRLSATTRWPSAISRPA